jgi:beta-1,4-mannosyl-glycoprotein beta-1,4-N-acetylglucosaminyltransferase
MTRFVDCFLFNDELDLLEFRLTEHDPFTDYFILVESRKSFSARPKKLYATENITRYEKWKDRLIVVVLDDNEIKDKHGFMLEDYSRECAMKEVKRLRDDGYIDSHTLVSCVADTDEIFDKDKIDELKRKVSENLQKPFKPLRPLFRFHYYSLQISRPKNPVWTPQKRLKICKVSDLKYFTLVEIQTMIITDMRNIGWHLCYFGSLELVVSKLKSFSHASMKEIKDIASNPNLIKERIENNKDILGRDWESLGFKNPDKVPYNYDLLIKLNLDIHKTNVSSSTI